MWRESYSRGVNLTEGSQWTRLGRPNLTTVPSRAIWTAGIECNLAWSGRSASAMPELCKAIA